MNLLHRFISYLFQNSLFRARNVVVYLNFWVFLVLNEAVHNRLQIYPLLVIVYLTWYGRIQCCMNECTGASTGMTRSGNQIKVIYTPVRRLAHQTLAHLINWKRLYQLSFNVHHLSTDSTLVQVTVSFSSTRKATGTYIT